MHKKSMPTSSWKNNPLNTFLQETRSQCKLNPGDEKKYTHNPYVNYCYNLPVFSRKNIN